MSYATTPLTKSALELLARLREHGRPIVIALVDDYGADTPEARALQELLTAGLVRKRAAFEAV